MIYMGACAVKGNLEGARKGISFGLPDLMLSRMTSVCVQFELGKPSAGIT